MTATLPSNTWKKASLQPAHLGRYERSPLIDGKHPHPCPFDFWNGTARLAEFPDNQWNTLLETAMPAIDKGPYLKPCPFCGGQLDSQWQRLNPKAKCATEDCQGGRMPVLCLDVPRDIERWNQRATQELGAAR